MKLTPLDKTLSEQLKLKEHDALMATVQGIDWPNVCEVHVNQDVPLITMDREIKVMNWGLPMEFASRQSSLYWARAETVFSQQIFAAHALRRRAIAMIDGWWEHGRFIKTAHPVAVATIWQHTPEHNYFALVTQEANAQIATIHDRMPAIVDPDKWLDHKTLSEWIGVAQIEAKAA
jgi:putative SOS response-associated peptidase YedK